MTRRALTVLLITGMYALAIDRAVTGNAGRAAMWAGLAGAWTTLALLDLLDWWRNRKNTA